MTRVTIPLLILVLWIAVTGATGWLLYSNHLFATEAKRELGTVDRRFSYVSHSRRSFDPFPTTNYFIDYEYTTGPDRQMGERRVAEETYDALAVDGSVPVLYLPDHPVANRIAMPAEEEFFLELTYCLLGASVVVSVGLIVTWRDYLRAGA
jgi:hypothetical protein